MKADECQITQPINLRNYSETGYNYAMNEAIYKARRDTLAAKMDDGIAVIGTASPAVRSNDTEYPYRPDSDFYYLTGFEEDNAVLVLTKRAACVKSLLFVQPKDEKMELWTGKRLGVDAAAERFDVDEVFSIETYTEKLPELMQNLPRLYIDLFSQERIYAEVKTSAERLRHKRETKRPVSRMIDVRQLVREMRLVKSSEEISVIRRGLAITAEAHHHAMKVCRGGMTEYRLQAEYEYVFKKNGAKSDAYSTIVAGGDHANTLHYVKNDDVLKAGELVLIDAGCEYGYYATDITRTFPVDGRFSAAQREVYDAVLDVQERIIGQIGPGRLKSDLQKAAERMLCEKMVALGILEGDVEKLLEEKKHKKYFPHGIGHWMGIDVHDPAPYYDEKGDEIALVPGMLLTVEPGLYLPADDLSVPEKYRGIGIRIEDDILVTEIGCENLSEAIVKTASAVEAMCVQNS